MNISEFTAANGWSEFPVGISNCNRNFAKQFSTKYQCQCNTRSTIQVVLKYWSPLVIVGSGETVSLVLTGESLDGEWLNLEVYGLKQLSSIDHHCQVLLTGWEAINEMIASSQGSQENQGTPEGVEVCSETS